MTSRENETVLVHVRDNGDEVKFYSDPFYYPTMFVEHAKSDSGELVEQVQFKRGRRPYGKDWAVFAESGEAELTVWRRPAIHRPNARPARYGAGINLFPHYGT
jgi:hypothetical protein